MTILELRNMTKRELAIWTAKAKTSDYKQVLDNENLSGGIAKFTKEMLVEVVMDLIDGVISELTMQLKPKRKRKPLAEEIKLYREMLKPLYFGCSLKNFMKSGRGSFFEGCYDDERKKYLKMVKYFHPDKPTGDEEKFKKIQAAWEMAESDFYDFEDEMSDKAKEILKKHGLDKMGRRK